MKIPNDGKRQQSKLPASFVGPVVDLNANAENKRLYRHVDDFGDRTHRLMIDHFTAALDELRPDVRQSLALHVQPIFDQACDEQEDFHYDASSLEELASRSQQHKALANAVRQWSRDFSLDTPVLHQLALQTVAETYNLNSFLKLWCDMERNSFLAEFEPAPESLRRAKQIVESLLSSHANVDGFLPRLASAIDQAGERDIPLAVVVTFFTYVFEHGAEAAAKQFSNDWGSLGLTITLLNEGYFEFSTFPWQPYESLDDARWRITEAFERALNSHLSKTAENWQSKALEETKTRDLRLWARWLVQFQVNEKTVARIVQEDTDYVPQYGRKLVPKGIDQAAIILAGNKSWLRPRRPGRPPSRGD